MSVAVLTPPTVPAISPAAASPPREMRSRRRPTRRTVAIGAVLAGLIVIGAAAAALSFASIAGLAVQCGIPPELAWLLPIVIDAGVVVGTIVWLSRRLFPNEDARRLAAGYTIGLLAVSVLTNVTNHVLTVEHLSPHLIVIAAVSALAPITIGLVVHLAVTALRPGADAPGGEHAATEKDGDADADVPVDTTGDTTGDADADADSADDSADDEESVDTTGDANTDADADGYTAAVRATAIALGLTLAPAPARENRQARRLRIARERKRVRRAADKAAAAARDPEDVLVGG
jgi:hypothetical protein